MRHRMRLAESDPAFFADGPGNAAAGSDESAKMPNARSHVVTRCLEVKSALYPEQTFGQDSSETEGLSPSA